MSTSDWLLILALVGVLGVVVCAAVVAWIRVAEVVR